MVNDNDDDDDDDDDDDNDGDDDDGVISFEEASAKHLAESRATLA